MPSSDMGISILSFGFLSTTVICFGIYVLLRCAIGLNNYRWRINKLKQLPGFKGDWLLGALSEFPGPGEDGLKFMKDRNAEYPKLAHSFYGPFQAAVGIIHPDPVKDILKTSEPKPLNFGGYFNSYPWLGDGLLLAKGKKWARNRRLLTPAFHFDILKPYVAVNNRAADVLIEKIYTSSRKSEYFEVIDNVSLCTLDVILRCAFSFEEDIQKQGVSHPYVKAVQELAQTMVYRLLSPWLYPDILFYLSPTGRRFKRNCGLVHAMSDKVIRRRKQALKEQDREVDNLSKAGKYLDFLDILLTAKDDDGVGLTDREIRNEVDTFLFEGHDTTASGISWALYTLAQHPQWQHTCQQEIDKILDGRSSDHIEWNDLPDLKTLTLCIKESLRLNTAVPFIQRETTKDMYIDGYFIPAGTQIDIMLYMVMHNSEVWDNPMEFRPERFSAENAEKLHAYGHIPFSAGPRNCIGQNFAMHEMKTILARVLRKFDLHVDPERPAKREVQVVMKTENGMYIRAVPRHQMRDGAETLDNIMA